MFTIEKCDQIGTPKTGSKHFLNNPFWNGSLITQSKFGLLFFLERHWRRNVMTLKIEIHCYVATH